MKKDLIVNVNGYPFVSYVEQKTINGEFNLSKIYEKNAYHSNMSDCLNNGYIKVMGYMYDLKPYLNRYIIDAQYGLIKLYAPNKTLLRNICDMGKIYNILEIKTLKD